MQGSVLIVDGDRRLRHSLARALESAGLKVSEAPSGKLALAKLQEHPFDLVLLDPDTPGTGGIAACGKMREVRPELSVIVLSVDDIDEDTASPLDAGADDYVTKPFRLTEVTARIRAVIRRTQPKSEEKLSLHIGDIYIDPIRHRVLKTGREVHVTPKEFELLRLLMLQAGRPISHQELLRSVWGPAREGAREYLRTYVCQLRRKLEDDPAKPRYLITENYIGYRFMKP